MTCVFYEKEKLLHLLAFIFGTTNVCCFSNKNLSHECGNNFMKSTQLSGEDSNMKNIACAMLAGSLSSAIANPTDVLKVCRFYFNRQQKWFFFAPAGAGCSDWKCSNWDKTLYSRTNHQCSGFVTVHQPPSICQQPCHQIYKFPSSLPSQYCPGPIILNLSARMGTGVSKEVWAVGMARLTIVTTWHRMMLSCEWHNKGWNL